MRSIKYSVARTLHKSTEIIMNEYFALPQMLLNTKSTTHETGTATTYASQVFVTDGLSLIHI